MPLALIPQRLFTGSDVFILLAVPFFILAGQIMEQGGVARRVIKVADESTRFVTGGLGHVTVSPICSLRASRAPRGGHRRPRPAQHSR